MASARSTDRLPNTRSRIREALTKRFKRLSVRKTASNVGFLELPREIRDLIYYAIIAEHPKLVVKKSFTTFPRPNAYSGVYGVLLVNKQVSAEFREALYYALPHHLQISVEHGSPEQGPINLAKATLVEQRGFLASARFLYVHLYYCAKDSLISDEEAHLSVLLDTGFETSLEILKHCIKTTHLILDCTVWMSSLLRDAAAIDDMILTALLYNTVVKLVESLPQLLQYAVQVIIPSARNYTIDAVCATRGRDTQWSSDHVVRDPVLEHDRRRPQAWDELYSIVRRPYDVPMLS